MIDINFPPLSEKEKFIARKIVDAADAVHKDRGPGSFLAPTLLRWNEDNSIILAA